MWVVECQPLWSEAATELLGRWGRDDNPMPDPAEQELPVSAQRHRPWGHAVVACSCWLPSCHRSWRIDHPAKIRAWFIPVSQARRGDPHRYRFLDARKSTTTYNCMFLSLFSFCTTLQQFIRRFIISPQHTFCPVMESLQRKIMIAECSSSKRR